MLISSRAGLVTGESGGCGVVFTENPFVPALKTLVLVCIAVAIWNTFKQTTISDY